MRQGGLLVGLDVGTSKICAIVGEVREEHINIISIGKAPSTGLRKGVVVNIDATVESIRAAVEEAGKTTGVEIQSVYAGIAGGHISTLDSYGVVGIKGKEVTKRDIARAVEAAKVVYVPLDREVLHVLPMEYTVDGQDGILNPLGMTGVRLESKVKIVTGAVSAVQNLVKCCQRAGLHVAGVVLEPLASSMAVLSDEEKSHGVLLIDIGGGTTDIALYEKGILQHTSVIAIGGHHITNDIAVGLRLPAGEAERVKREFSSAVPTPQDRDEIEIMVAGRDLKKIPRSYLTEIVAPRCEELFAIVKRKIHEFRGYDVAAYGVVLTGGSSMLRGIDTLGEAALGLPVRVGVPEGISGLKGIVCNPEFATGVGLLSYAMGEYSEKTVYADLLTEIFNGLKRGARMVSGITRMEGKSSRDKALRHREV